MTIHLNSNLDILNIWGYKGDSKHYTCYLRILWSKLWYLYRAYRRKYYNQDSGFDVQVQRYFGETLIRFFYQNADDQYIGLGFKLPLTPRYVANTPYGQIKGQNLFSHQTRTTVRSDTGINFAKPGGLINPVTEFDIENRFLNRNRLTESYLKNHILRLRDVYFTYVKP